MTGNKPSLAFYTGILSLSVFVLLLLIAHLDPDDFRLVDAAATDTLLPFRTLPWIQFFVGLTTLGNSLSIVVVALGVAFTLRHNRALVLRLAIALIGTSVSVELIKQAIARVRPEALAWIGPLHSFSFPSGHAATALALFGFMAVVVYQSTFGRATRIALVALLALLTLGIGISRIVLAAHYASDVFAGYALASAWVSFAFLLPIASLHTRRARIPT